MGFTIMAESHIEHRFIMKCELHQDEILEYWDQPCEVPITGTDRRGRRYRSTYTADFLIFTPMKVVAIETKPYAKCLELHGRRPEDWRKISDGFSYEPAVQAFAQLGIRHQVVTDRDIGATEANNYDLLLYARDNPPVVSSRWRTEVAKALQKHKALPIRELLVRTGSGDVTPILFLIHTGVLHADIRHQNLAEVDDSLIALDIQTLNDALAAQRKLTCAIDPTHRVSIEDVPRTADGIRLLYRWKQLNGELPPTVSRRTLRRWRSKVRSQGSDAALVPRCSAQGNRRSRISEEHVAFIDSVLEKEYLTADSIPPYRCYGRYREAFDARTGNTGGPAVGHDPVSFKSFLRRLRRLDPVTTALARGGRRAANEAEPPVAPEQKELLACRPFQRVHIDHCRVKVHLRIGESGGRVIRARAWLTIMVDEYSGAILAMSLSFRAPSRRSCALVLRDCAMRWRRLPHTIVVDNGKEFDSVYFEACLARLGIHKQSRPPGHPRYGSTVERAFGILKDEFLSVLTGNTANRKDDRGKSTSHKGWTRGKYTLLELHLLIEHYFFRLLNHHLHGRELEAPSVRIREGLKRYPSSGRQVAFDQTFLVMTAIEQSRQHTWDPRRGIRLRGRYYSHPGLAGLPNRKRFEVREEPWDEHCIYVRVNHEWLACYHGPRPNSQLVTPARICASILWSDANYPREKAKIARLLAQQETRRKAMEIAHAIDSSRPEHVPEIDFPAFRPSSPLPEAYWRET
jgi:putative transposase